MTWFVQALEIKSPDGGRSGKWRLCADSDEDGGFHPLCEHEHESPEDAMRCLDARRMEGMVTGIPHIDRTVEQPSFSLSVNDPCMLKIHVQSVITALRDEDGKTKTRELSIAVTKLQEAVMWIDEHLRLS